MTDAPLPYPGTPDQIKTNRNTHRWHSLDGDDYRCLVCDCNAYGTVADWPCGTEPPRHAGQLPLGKVPWETDGTGITDYAYEDDRPDTPWGFTP